MAYPGHHRRAESQAAAARAKRVLRRRLLLCLAASLLVHVGLGLYMQRCRLDWGSEKRDQKIAEVAEQPTAPDFHWTQQQQPSEEPFERPLTTPAPAESVIPLARDQQAELSTEKLPSQPGDTLPALMRQPSPADLARAARPSARETERLAAEKMERRLMPAEAISAPAEQPRVAASPALPRAQSSPTIAPREQSRPIANQPPPTPARVPRAVPAIGSLTRQNQPSSPGPWAQASQAPRTASLDLPDSRLPTVVPEEAPPQAQRPLPEQNAARTVTGRAPIAAVLAERPVVSAEAAVPEPAIRSEKLAKRGSSSGPLPRLDALAGTVPRASLLGEASVTSEREVAPAAASGVPSILSQPLTRIERGSQPAMAATAPLSPTIALAHSLPSSTLRQPRQVAPQKPTLADTAGEVFRQRFSEPIAAAAEAASAPAPVVVQLQLTPSAPAGDVLPRQVDLAMVLPRKPRPPVVETAAKVPQSLAPEVPNRRHISRNEGATLARWTTVSPVRDPAAAQAPVYLATSTTLPPAEELRPSLSPTASSEVTASEPTEVPLDRSTTGQLLGTSRESPRDRFAVQRVGVHHKRSPADSLPYQDRANPGVPRRGAATAQVPVALAPTATLPAAEELRRRLSPAESSGATGRRPTEASLELSMSRQPLDEPRATSIERPVAQATPSRKKISREDAKGDAPSTVESPARGPAAARVPVYRAAGTALPASEESKRSLSPGGSSEAASLRPKETSIDLSVPRQSLGEPRETPIDRPIVPATRSRKKSSSENSRRDEPRAAESPSRGPAAARVLVYLATTTPVPGSEEKRSVLSAPPTGAAHVLASHARDNEPTSAASGMRLPEASPPLPGIAIERVPRRISGDAQQESLATATLPGVSQSLAKSERPAESVRQRGLGRQFMDPGAAVDRLSARIPGETAGIRGSPGRSTIIGKSGVHRAYGGSPSAERTVALGLEYLARCQFADGHWSLHRVPDSLLTLPDPAWGETQSDTAATGLALLALLGAGYTHTDGKYQAAVDHGLTWLIAAQKPEGDLFNGGTSFAWFYSQGIGAIALCEAYGMTADPKLHEPARKAIEFILRSQHPELGGWRYYPRAESDTSVTGWQLMALRSAQMSGLPVPETPLGKIRRWLDSAQSGQHGGLYSYNPKAADGDPAQQSRAPTLAMTAEGLLMRVYLGWPANHPGLIEGADHLLRNLPSLGDRRRPARDAYYWYYATQFMFQMQGPYWLNWSNALHTVLENTQIRSGPWAGSWHPMSPVPDRWGQSGGRLYVTAMHLLTLEVYSRYLPLFELRSKSR